MNFSSASRKKRSGGYELLANCQQAFTLVKIMMASLCVCLHSIGQDPISLSTKTLCENNKLPPVASDSRLGVCVTHVKSFIE